MKYAVRIGLAALCLAFVCGGIVYAAAGSDFSWLSTSDGGILIGEEGSEGENVPPADTLTFANEDSKILFSEDGGTIDFDGTGEISSGTGLLGARLSLRHDNDINVEAGNGMMINCVHDASLWAEEFHVDVVVVTEIGRAHV